MWECGVCEMEGGEQGCLGRKRVDVTAAAIFPIRTPPKGAAAAAAQPSRHSASTTTDTTSRLS